MDKAGTSTASALEAARRLAPSVREVRQEIEQERRLPATLVEAMTEAGLLRLWVARAFGGLELSFVELLPVIEELSRADGSVGWCTMIASTWGRLSGVMAAEVAGEIFTPSSRLAGSVNPTGKAVAVPGGFRVSGRWTFGSFIGHSRWTVGNSVVHDGDTPRATAVAHPISAS